MSMMGGGKKGNSEHVGDTAVKEGIEEMEEESKKRGAKSVAGKTSKVDLEQEDDATKKEESDEEEEEEEGEEE